MVNVFNQLPGIVRKKPFRIVLHDLIVQAVGKRTACDDKEIGSSESGNSLKKLRCICVHINYLLIYR